MYVCLQSVPIEEWSEVIRAKLLEYINNANCIRDGVIPSKNSVRGRNDTCQHNSHGSYLSLQIPSFIIPTRFASSRFDSGMDFRTALGRKDVLLLNNSESIPCYVSNEWVIEDESNSTRNRTFWGYCYCVLCLV